MPQNATAETDTSLRIFDHKTKSREDRELQTSVNDAIVAAADQGQLIGTEAPVWKVHTFPHNEDFAPLAPVLQAQLNHLAPTLGLLGFSVDYRKGAIDSDIPLRGYFQIRAFAKKQPADASNNNDATS